MKDILQSYQSVRQWTLDICEPLETEDYVVQPAAHVSPPKWHLGHTTWFFETFVLKPHKEGYKEFHSQYNYVFNSYYESVGARVLRTDRGNLSRPSVDDILQYRAYVDEEMESFLPSLEDDNLYSLIILGLNHEQQHQELMITDLKYILGHNPLFPVFSEKGLQKPETCSDEDDFVRKEEGVYEIGFEGTGFCFDNECNKHKVYLNPFEISKHLVTNIDFLHFIESGGYADFKYWHSDGWAWVLENEIKAPLYWYEVDGEWKFYTLEGLKTLDLSLPVCHVSYYEAAAFAAWKGMRLPTEAEWEVAATDFDWGKRWEWTGSAYLPYPGFEKAPGAVGEYNGKFMVSQKVLRGASEATSPGHSRRTYRNFFQPYYRWQFTGLRLAK
ncbi:MAG TPA: ergothioneine biosynthesis protein EgtB [Chitinophagaceae bacterium]|nr:ergothioneine biosynthesis protein EgtB [Chitinophagaceae bacterium]